MPAITDPARELSDLIRGLTIKADLRMDTGLAELFEVDAWSSQFYQIIFSISSRIDELMALTEDLPLDDDHKQEMKTCLRQISHAFGPNGLQNAFGHSLGHYLAPANVMPLSALSGLVRQIHSYPKLDDDERISLVEQIDELLGWLVAHQLSDQDFIRQALIEGLGNLKFRLQRIRWFGWGYTLQSLREVISAYFALERGFPIDGSNPPAEAMLRIVAGFVREFLKKTAVVRETVETGDFMLRAYGAVQLLLAGQTTIAGLLGHGPSAS